MAAWEVTHWCSRHTQPQIIPPDQCGGDGRSETSVKVVPKMNNYASLVLFGAGDGIIPSVFVIPSLFLKTCGEVTETNLSDLLSVTMAR